MDSLRRPLNKTDIIEFPSTNRTRKPQYADTVHHYCEEFWFKTNVDIVLNMTAVIPVIDDLFQNYFPSLLRDPRVTPAHSRAHVGLTRRSHFGSISNREKQSTLDRPVVHQTKLY